MNSAELLEEYVLGRLDARVLPDIATKFLIDGVDTLAMAQAALPDTVDARDVRGVEGARPNSWASGMQRDMGSGMVCFQLTIPRVPRRPPQAHTLDPAPAREVGTVDEQDGFQVRWHASFDPPTEP